MKEKDIKIITLSDSKLQIFSPPTSINQYNKSPSPNIPLNPKGGFTYFSKVEYLGSGGFSKVYKYRGDLENKAVKKIMADPKYYSKVLTAEDSIKREVYGMTKVDCNHSLKVYGVYQNTNKDIFYILMEQCDGNIETYMKDRGYPLNINEIIILLSQLNDAFYLLDKNNIIHRDIKPSNILYKEEKDNPHNKRGNKKIFEGKKMVFKLGDYGICIPLYDKKYSKSQFMGTLDYMAPEIYEMKCEKEHPIFTKKIDLFSLGQSILWLMGFFPKANTLTQNVVEDLKKNCKLFEGNHKEKLLADLVFNHLLIFDPNKRDGWEEYFNHPLFEEYGIFQENEGNLTDGNSQRVNKRVIKRNNLELNKNNKLFNSEKKIDLGNKLNIKIDPEKNNKNNNIIKNNISIYKYKVNTNVERPFINTINIKTNITHKNTVVKNLRYANDIVNINEQKNNKDKKNNINIINIGKIEKKKTFDFKNVKKLIDNNKNIEINENNNNPNKIRIITNNYFYTKNENDFGRNSLDGLRVKKYLNDINSHFVDIRSKYKKMSLNKDNNNNVNNKKEKAEIKITKLSASFAKERKNEEKKNNSKEKYSKSHKKYNYINLIDKKNANNNIKEIKNNNNNIKEINLNYNNYKNKKYLSIKVINYRVEENKKNKNIGFYFSKYSNTTAKPKSTNTKIN